MNAADRYIEGNNLQTRDDIDLIDEFEEEISEMHGICIDIGCGPGDVTRQYLLPKLPPDATVVGCDISREMIDHAKTVNVDEAKLSFIELDIETGNLPTNQVGAYDNAVSFFCMQWCNDIRKAFENTYSLLRPNATLLANIVRNCDLYDIIYKIQENPKYASHMKEASKYDLPLHKCENPVKKLKNILRECGFQVTHCSVRDKTYTFDNSQIANQWLQGVNMFSERMPRNLRDEFENDFFQEFINTTIVFDKCGEQRHMMKYSTLVLHAKKN